jgi:type II secretory pathway pseudopilin PulG
VVSGGLATVRMSAPLPALSSLVLSPADFRSGAAGAAQASTTVGGQPAFVRVFNSGVRIGTAPLLGAVSLVMLEPEAAIASADFADLNGTAQSRAGRQALAKAWAIDFVKGAKVGSHGKAKLTVKQTVVGAPVEVGSNAFRLPLTIKTNLGTMRISLEVAQTDRVLAIVVLMGRLNGRLDASDAAHALAAAQQHLQEAFTVANTTAPTISGSQTQGQVVSVDEGNWTGTPSAFGYSWSRCDTSGANCAPIADATTNTYTVTAADAGSTLRVTVTGTNSFSSQQGVSSATAVVS